MSNEQQGKSNSGKPDEGKETIATTAPQLSKDCTDEIARVTGIKHLGYIIAYATNGKPEQFVLANGVTLQPQNCDPVDRVTEYSVPSGRCGRGPKPMLTCRWVSVGSTLYWVCA